MKKVLLISYYFPPSGGTAVQRVSKFAKYLPRHGWEPIVLTAGGQDYVVRDESLLTEIPDHVKIIRTRAPDVYRWIGTSGKKSGGAADLSALAASGGQKRGFLSRAALLVRSMFFVPDARILWLPFAFFAGLRIIRRERPAAILTTSPPFTTALIGGLLSSTTGLPWISDYRDPWTQAYFYFRRPQPARGFEEFLERKLLVTATRVVSINDRLLEGLRHKYGLSKDDRWEVIPNGFDPEDFEGIEPIVDDGFTITYTGTLHTRKHPATFLEAVKRLMEEDAGFARDVRLRFIGRIGEDVLPMLEEESIRSRVTLMGHLSHKECLRYTMAADLLLLIIAPSPNNALIMTGKLFEYLRSGNPILCLADKGEAAEIIRDTSAGYAVAFDDVEGIMQAVRQAYSSKPMRRTLLKEPDYLRKIDKFDRQLHSKRLANIIVSVEGRH